MRPRDTGVSAFPATMVLSLQEDSSTPLILSNRTSINGDLHRKSSNGSIQSQEGSISNFTCFSPRAAIDKGLFDLSGGRGHFSNHSLNLYSGRDPSISDDNISHHSEKPTLRCRNQSQSSICTLSELEFDRSSTATSSTQKPSIFSFEDEVGSSPPSTPCSPCAPTLITDTSPSSSPVVTDPPTPLSGDGDFKSLATAEVSTAVTPNIQECQEPLSNVNTHASTAADDKGPFPTVQQEFSRFTLPPGQGMATSFAPAPPPYSSLSNTVNPTYLYTYPTGMATSFMPSPPHPSSTNTPNLTGLYPYPTGMATSFVPSPPHPSLTNTPNLTGLYPYPNGMATSFVPSPPHPSLTNTPNLTGLYPYPTETATSFVPSPPHPSLANTGNLSVLYPNPTPPAYLMGTVSPSPSLPDPAKGRKGMLGSMTKYINSSKHTLAVQEIFRDGAKFVGLASGRSRSQAQSPPIPGTSQAAFPGLSMSVDNSFIPTVSVLPRSPPSDSSELLALSTMKQAHSPGGPQVVFLPHPQTPYPPQAAPTPPQPVQPNLDVSNPQQSRISASVPQTAFIKIKIFDRVQDDLIVTRVHSHVTHEQLLDKVQQRLGRQVVRLSFRRETGEDGEDYVLLQQDDDILRWIGSTDEHVLYVD